MSKTNSIISALFCTFIWGTTFIAQDTGMENIGPYTINGVRFFVGFFTLIPFYFLEKKNKIEISKNKKRFFYFINTIGVFLFLGYCIFQQVALLYTDVANAAFFTIFYVPMVPIIVFFISKKKFIGVYGHLFFLCCWWLFFNKLSRCNIKTWRWTLVIIWCFILGITYYFYWKNY